jgi:hypothetical protein
VSIDLRPATPPAPLTLGAIAAACGLTTLTSEVTVTGVTHDSRAVRPGDLFAALPALARLFPDAYLDDVGSSAQFRRFTERSLRETKLAHAATAIETLRRSGDKVTLSADDAVAWLGALNDVRLALGTRLGVTEEALAEFAELPEEDPRAATYHVYDWLTFLQESLVRAVMR